MGRFSPFANALVAGTTSLQGDRARKKQEQIALEDRIAQKEMRDLQMRKLEDELNRPAAPEPLDVTLDAQGNPVYTPRSQAAGRRAPRPAEPLEVVIGQGGKPTYTPRSQASGKEAPRAAEPLVQVATPEGGAVYRPRSEAVGAAAPKSGDGERKPAEFEKKAAFMLEGAESAHRALEGYKAPARSFVRNVPGLGNYGMAPEDQVAGQAAETLADAYLRLTTGATITPEEVKNTARQMVPTPGDAEPVLAAKKARREQVIRAIRQAASIAQPEASAAKRSGGKLLSAEDAAKAKADPGFAAWLRSQGYEVP